ncbi:MAG: hypothetical protein ACJATI_003470 [Halioglobus sp.]|jgi:hypothetical protein
MILFAKKYVRNLTKIDRTFESNNLINSLLANKEHKSTESVFSANLYQLTILQTIWQEVKHLCLNVVPVKNQGQLCNTILS